MITAEIECRDFRVPDEKLDFQKRGFIDIVQMSNGTTAMHAVLRPGCRWETDEKPLLGNPPSCPMAHTGYCIAGALVVRMSATAAEKTIRRGDFFEIPPGHDAWVSGKEDCELILVSPAPSD